MSRRDWGVTAIVKSFALLALPKEMFDLFDSVAECVQILDREGRVVFSNPAGLVALGFADIEAVHGHDFASFWPDAAGPRVAEALRKSGDGANAALMLVQPSSAGGRRWWDVTFTPLCRAEGKVTHVVALARDVTAHKIREHDLAARLERRDHEVAALAARLAALEQGPAGTPEAPARSDQRAPIGGGGAEDDGEAITMIRRLGRAIFAPRGLRARPARSVDHATSR